MLDDPDDDDDNQGDNNECYCEYHTKVVIGLIWTGHGVHHTCNEIGKTINDASW